MRRHKQYTIQNKINNFKCCIVISPNFFAFRSPQWTEVLCRNAEWLAGASPHLFVWFHKLVISAEALNIQVFHCFFVQIAQEIAFFLFPSHSIKPINLLIEHFGACGNQNFHCSTQLPESFLYTKLLALSVGSILEEEMSIPESCH